MANDERPPAFLFYVNDFASDGLVEAMTTEGVGAYILLLCKAWREDPPGTIPNDDNVLARWARLTPDRWSELRPAVLAPFSAINDGTRLCQKRMQQEYRKLVESKAARRKASQLGAKARWHTASMPPQSERNAFALLSEIDKEDAFEDFWERFPRRRRKSKGTAREAFFKALRKVDDVAVILNATTAYAASDKAKGEYVQMPSTWLNQECWNDAPEAWRDYNKPQPEPEKPYYTVNAAKFADFVAAKRFTDGPHRNPKKPSHVRGVLDDGSRVACIDYPVPAEAAK